MIKLDKVSKKFGTGVFGLSDVSLVVDRGEFIFLVGPTGSGKTTILKLLIRDILPTEGSVVVSDFDVVNIKKNNLPILRKKIGVIFQDLKLLFDRTVLENVSLPLEVAGKKPEEAIKLVDDVLEQVGLLDHKDKFPVQLSGGELQRVAIARALILSPEIILADEPTGNLDNDTSWEIVNILTDINKKGTTIIMATHNEDVIKTLGKRVVHIEKGKIVKDEKGHSSFKASEGQVKKDSKKHKEEDKKEKDEVS
nr:cell division ATP-binding protein FtsE [Candidatus Levybacteria bacterium]